MWPEARKVVEPVSSTNARHVGVGEGGRCLGLGARSGAFWVGRPGLKWQAGFEVAAEGTRRAGQLCHRHLVGRARGRTQEGPLLIPVEGLLHPALL